MSLNDYIILKSLFLNRSFWGGGGGGGVGGCGGEKGWPNNPGQIPA
jgi:hypothetical protein